MSEYKYIYGIHFCTKSVRIVVFNVCSVCNDKSVVVAKNTARNILFRCIEKKKQFACYFILRRFRIKLYLLKKYYFQTKPLKNSKSTMKRYRFRSWKRKYSSKNSQTCLPAGHQMEILRMWKCLESRNVSDLLSTNCGSEAQYKGYFSCWILLSIFM